MNGINKVIVVGHVGGDPELRETKDGQKVATISVATNSQWKDKAGNEQKKTEWHRVVAWGKLAENVQKYVTKGKQVYVEGRLETQQWKDEKNGGITRYTTNIVANTIQFLGTAGAGGDRAPHPAELETGGFEVNDGTQQGDSGAL